MFTVLDIGRYPVLVENLSYSYPSKPNVLKNVTLKVERGEAVGIIGPNGAGKSTLCKALNGLVPHFYGGRISGRVYVAGMDTLKHTVAELATKVGLVFQEPETQLSGLALTVEDEISFGLAMLGYPKDVIKTRTAEAIKRVGLQGLERRSPFELSGGQQQRLAIATVLAMRPEVIVLDEPTSQLDPIGKAQVFDVLRELLRDGTTIVVAEHEIEELATFTNRMLLLNNGRVLCEGSAKDVLNQVELLKSVGVDPPSVTELAHLVKKFYQLGIIKYPITLEEAVSIFAELLVRGGAK
ncbi:cobalt/nickel ABC transporter ATP-binding protein [Candidatus Caldarchaeum subterraneum]|uniref:Cobalt/nickel ABC transporter ATP-binding protein n=1 Tax=Caldiarchaeum subterraneum TaxID=311458 RepID=E6N733_CALS0|nr:cobalt/nickel ABC transporter ATP-binding protein [Candidatus Caldarchaeum subterraneum]BAJ50885.1 cobalt/nickel ABC transporter ATP-binding protein [Candidatus Caldarchaeum subterraneum]GBC72335.1 Energy-coupling factor transporter ATP-binding protein EcfA1 [archaeon HR03]